VSVVAVFVLSWSMRVSLGIARGGDSADIKAGLEYAEANEWLGYDGAKQAWYLTELGHEYA
jgi:hypothetical protein